jgi:hydroxymethylglutaryl-CoA lyase
MPPSTKRIRIVEVGPRDGLQDVKYVVSTRDKLHLISLLAKSGLSEIEATAFVSPKWVPQMADHHEVMRHAIRREGMILSALVPNERGARGAIKAGAQKLSVFTSASETFAKKNINSSIAQSIENFVPVARLAQENGLPLRGYISCAVHCPFEGAVPAAAVERVAQELRKIGCDEIAVADTIGHATPEEIKAMLEMILKDVPADIIAAHFHDAKGRALQNVDVALECGVTTFDAAIGGLGGCPYAPGAAGNVSTITLLRHLGLKGLYTGIAEAQVCEAENFVHAISA